MHRITTALLLAISSFAVCGTAQEKKDLTYDQIFNDGEPRLTKPIPAFMGWKDGSHFIRLEAAKGTRKLSVVDAASGRAEPYRRMEAYRELAGDEFDLDAPATANQNFTRLVYTKGGDLYCLDTERKTFSRLTDTPSEEKNPTISPDGKFVAFTRDHNLYAIDLVTGKEIQYTFDDSSSSSAISNGWAAWLYFEEIFGRPTKYRAFWWSPDGSMLAFYRFDQTSVPVYPLFHTSGVHGSLEATRYPQPGDHNPEVRIGIVPASGGSVVWADFDRKADQYFGPPFWVPDGTSLWVQWMNRAQDTLRICAVDPHSGGKRVISTEHQPTWVEWCDSLWFLPHGKGFILRSDKDGWKHFYLHDMQGAPLGRLTAGEWNAGEVKAIDDVQGKVYFTANKESSTRTDLYRVGFDGAGMERLTFGPYTHDVSVSPSGEYFLTNYANVTTPPRIALCTGNGTVVREVADSREKALDSVRWGKTEIFVIPTSDGYLLPALWTLPVDFDSTRRYPVIVSVYGGPDYPSVEDGWLDIERQWLAKEGVIQISVDHRGSGHFGKKGTALMYRNLGRWEMHDYGEAARWLRAQRCVDTTRMCITGGSYGGYVTCLAMTTGAGMFSYGLALYSVTDWRLYDSHYTERYMGLPALNPEGYANSSVMTHASSYKGLLRLVHGSEDDNVHLQNTLQLADTLEELGKHFELMIYPGVRHGWRGSKMNQLQNETYRFYYRYLLEKEFPAALFEEPGEVMGRHH